MDGPQPPAERARAPVGLTSGVCQTLPPVFASVAEVPGLLARSIAALPSRDSGPWLAGFGCGAGTRKGERSKQLRRVVEAVWPSFDSTRRFERVCERALLFYGSGVERAADESLEIEGFSLLVRFMDHFERLDTALLKGGAQSGGLPPLGHGIGADEFSDLAVALEFPLSVGQAKKLIEEYDCECDGLLSFDDVYAWMQAQALAEPGIMVLPEHNFSRLIRSLLAGMPEDCVKQTEIALLRGEIRSATQLRGLTPTAGIDIGLRLGPYKRFASWAARSEVELLLYYFAAEAIWLQRDCRELNARQRISLHQAGVYATQDAQAKAEVMAKALLQRRLESLDYLSYVCETLSRDLHRVHGQKLMQKLLNVSKLSKKLTTRVVGASPVLSISQIWQLLGCNFPKLLSWGDVRRCSGNTIRKSEQTWHFFSSNAGCCPLQRLQRKIVLRSLHALRRGSTGQLPVKAIPLFLRWVKLWHTILAFHEYGLLVGGNSYQRIDHIVRDCSSQFSSRAFLGLLTELTDSSPPRDVVRYEYTQIANNMKLKRLPHRNQSSAKNAKMDHEWQCRATEPEFDRLQSQEQIGLSFDALCQWMHRFVQLSPPCKVEVALATKGIPGLLHELGFTPVDLWEQILAKTLANYDKSAQMQNIPSSESDDIHLQDTEAKTTRLIIPSIRPALCKPLAKKFLQEVGVPLGVRKRVAAWAYGVSVFPCNAAQSNWYVTRSCRLKQLAAELMFLRRASADFAASTRNDL